MVLERLATGLNVVLAALFEPQTSSTQPEHGAEISRRADQASWRDPHSGYLRRNVSPPSASTAGGLVPSTLQIVAVQFPAGARVAYETGAREPAAVHQQVWVLEGTMQITVGEQTFQLDSGDCIAFTPRPAGRLLQPDRRHHPLRGRRAAPATPLPRR